MTLQAYAMLAYRATPLICLQLATAVVPRMSPQSLIMSALPSLHARPASTTLVTTSVIAVVITAQLAILILEFAMRARLHSPIHPQLTPVHAQHLNT